MTLTIQIILAVAGFFMWREAPAIEGINKLAVLSLPLNAIYPIMLIAGLGVADHIVGWFIVPTWAFAAGVYSILFIEKADILKDRN